MWLSNVIYNDIQDYMSKQQRNNLSFNTINIMNNTSDAQTFISKLSNVNKWTYIYTEILVDSICSFVYNEISFM